MLKHMVLASTAELKNVKTKDVLARATQEYGGFAV